MISHIKLLFLGAPSNKMWAIFLGTYKQKEDFKRGCKMFMEKQFMKRVENGPQNFLNEVKIYKIEIIQSRGKFCKYKKNEEHDGI